MTYKAVIFDLDGTLVNSLEDLADATNFALHFFGQQVHSTEAFKKMVGDGTKTLISRTLQPDKQYLIEDVLVKMREKYDEICLCKSRPYKGLTELVRELRSRGVKMAVITNKDQTMAQKIVNHFFGQDLQITAGTFNGIAIKPDPTVALQVLEKLGVTTTETIFVGDSNVDIQTAKAAKIKAVGVNWGFRGRDELVEAGADLVIDEPEELLKFFA